MKELRLALALAPLALGAWGLSGCKTTNSQTASATLPTAQQVAHMTLAQFVAACQQLQASSDPVDVDSVNTILTTYANTTDCATAYPVLEAKIATSGAGKH